MTSRQARAGRRLDKVFPSPPALTRSPHHIHLHLVSDPSSTLSEPRKSYYRHLKIRERIACHASSLKLAGSELALSGRRSFLFIIQESLLAYSRA